nr:HNH endonuclease signature motif containing protein [Photobacterium galatheae]
MLQNDLVTHNGLADRLKEGFELSKSDPDFRSASTRVKASAIFSYLSACLNEQAVRLDPVRRFSRAFAQKLFFESQDKSCAICSNQIHSFDDCDVDHRIPWALGGRTHADNAQLTHGRCNRQKGIRVGFNGSSL